MLQAIRATYKDGKLHPLEPLKLAEGQTVDIVITDEGVTPPETTPADEAAANPSLGLVGLLAGQTDATDLSTSVREALKKYTHPQY